MLTVALTLLSLAVLAGAILLTPRLTLLARMPRRRAAALHGTFGVTGLASVVLVAAGTKPDSQPLWLAVGLLAAGLVAGITIFVTCRHKRAPAALILALHVVFAGMGYLLFVGLVLS